MTFQDAPCGRHFYCGAYWGMISQLIFQVSALKRVDSRGRRQLSTVYRLSSIVILSALSVNRTQMTQKKPILLDFRGDCFLTLYIKAEHINKRIANRRHWV